ncbi:MAG TPA: hypothetical protein VNL37_00395 [Candidatus Polarisedimenticolia bacterium]|nr:hypothetical protein [Candidatus Polarisedimenticolia bacterium]
MRIGGRGRVAGRVLLGVGLALAAGGAAFGAGVDFRFGGALTRGDFGGDSTIELIEAPLELVMQRPAARFTISVPWVRIDRTGLVVPTPDGPAVLGIDAGGAGRPSFQTSPPGGRQSGLGDVTLREETYLLRAGGGLRPWLALVLDLKLSTADESKGLGTGRRDWGAGLDYVQPLGKTWQILAGGGKRFMGDPKGLDFNDRRHLRAGFAIVTSRVAVRAQAETVTPLLDEVPAYNAAGVPIGLRKVDDRRTATVDVTFRSPLGGTTRVGVVKGLTNASEDFGVMVTFSTGSQ